METIAVYKIGSTTCRLAVCELRRNHAVLVYQSKVVATPGLNYPATGILDENAVLQAVGKLSSEVTLLAP